MEAQLSLASQGPDERRGSGRSRIQSTRDAVHIAWRASTGRDARVGWFHERPQECRAVNYVDSLSMDARGWAGTSAICNARGVPMPTESLNGIKSFYERQGVGPPIVLVHGSWGDHHNWDAVVPGLAREYDVIRYDRRGHSQSLAERARAHTRRCGAGCG
jgi:pimeloyl-ACP methyl ester carboxylesterase